MSIRKSSIFIYLLLNSLFGFIGYSLIVIPMLDVFSGPELHLTTTSLLFLAMFFFSIIWGLTIKFVIAKRTKEENKEETVPFVISAGVIVFLSFILIYTK